MARRASITSTGRSSGVAPSSTPSTIFATRAGGRTASAVTLPVGRCVIAGSARASGACIRRTPGWFSKARVRTPRLSTPT